MAHPFAGKAMTSRDRAKSLSKGYKLGGSVGKSATANVKKYANGGKATSDTKVPGKASGGRLDKFARGGRAKGKGHNTKINITLRPRGIIHPLVLHLSALVVLHRWPGGLRYRRVAFGFWPDS